MFNIQYLPQMTSTNNWLNVFLQNREEDDQKRIMQIRNYRLGLATIIDFVGYFISVFIYMYNCTSNTGICTF